MHQEKTLYPDPIVLLNLKLNQYGYIKNIYNNPLSLLIHMFYSFGNGYEFVDKKNIYWENLTKIVSSYSLIQQIPENLSPEWKKVLEILQDKMITFDPQRVKEALRLKNYEK